MESTLRTSAAALLLAAASLSAQQTPAPAPAGTGSIAGRVIDATTNQPVDGARVSARIGRAQTFTPSLTAADGTFTLTALAAGDITLSAAKTGYGTASYGMPAPYGPSGIVDLADGERATGVVVKLWKSATLSGFVTDESGRPAARIEVTAMPIGVIAGRAGIEAGRSVLTDQQGYYSLSGLIPNRYIVTAFAASSEAPAGRAGGGGARQSLEAYPRVFFPDALSASEATPVELTPGQVRNDVDFALHTRATVTVSGVVTGLPAGAAVSRAELVREPAANGVWSNLSTASVVTTAGGFTFRRVPPGRYVVRVVEFPSTGAVSGGTIVTQLTLAASLGMTRTGSPTMPLAPMAPEPTWWGDASVTVGDSAVTGVSVAIQKGARLRGTLAFEGTGAKPTPEGLLQSAIGVVAPDGRRLPGFQMARLERDSTFVTVGLPPGTYALVPLAGVQSLSGGPATWPDTWTSIRTSIAGQDQPGELIHLGNDDLTVSLTLSETPTMLSGMVTDASGTPYPDASVYIFRSDRRLWTAGAPSREVRPNRHGRYRADLPPGEYFVIASKQAAALWMEASSLEKLAASATLVRLSRGDKIAQDLSAR
ncbi:MAG TPA: carboxypeptidase-like regulatory domain-containing protein [Vicinamibacterales bacterium]|nr:carboxypeptidase-like regulatory domain-containing protein [Vicinamibacterales bacterium]